MHFFNWSNANSFIKDFTPKMDEGKAECICEGSDEPIPWRPVEKSGVDGWWTRFCITEEPIGFVTHYIVGVVTWPDGALKDPSIKPTIREVMRMRETPHMRQSR